MPDTPNPGSDAAIDMGCNCTNPGKYHNEGCPAHGAELEAVSA